MKMTRASFLALALLAITAPARARAAAGAESFDFLLFDPSARAVGMGGAYTALASDANALFYNPAGLARTKSYEATFMHNQHVEGLTQEYIGFASRHGWGASLNFLNFGGITRTRVDAPDGGIGTVGLTDLSLGGGYGHALSEWFSVGGGVKFLREKIADASATGFAADAGAMADVPSLPGLTLGAAILNIGPAVRFQSVKEKLPLLGRVGASYAFNSAKTRNTLSIDSSKARTDKVRLGFGAESVFDKVMAVRIGFNTKKDAGIGIAGGMGFFWKTMDVDYAFAPFGELGFTHRLSLTLRWGGERHPAERASEPEPAPALRRKEPPAPTDSEDLQRIRYNEKLGRAALAQEDCAQAKTSFLEALRIATAAGVTGPVVSDAYAGMARCMRIAGRTDYARRFFNKALEAGPAPDERLRIQGEIKALRATK